MTLRDMVPWNWGGLHHSNGDAPQGDTSRRDVDRFHREIDRLFDAFWHSGGRSPFDAGSLFAGELVPSVDETEDEHAFHVRIELPGMDKDDVKVTLSDGKLAVRGEKRESEDENGKDFHRRERRFGSFRRVMSIPADIDETKIEASFKKGVLCIDLPKTEEAQQKVKNIEVKAA